MKGKVCVIILFFLILATISHASKFSQFGKFIKGKANKVGQSIKTHDTKTTVAAVRELKKACKQKEFKNMIRLYYKLQDQEIPAIIQLFGY